MTVIFCLALVTAAVAGSPDVDFNPKADFDHYRTWGWLPDREKGLRGVLADATMRQRVEKALSNHLRETGLVPAPANETPDLFVGYRGDLGAGQEVSTSIGGLRSLDNPVYSTIHFREQTATLMVDLVDAKTESLAWRLYIDQTIKGPTDPPDKMAKALAKGFAKYPPTASEIARKAKQLEKDGR